MTKWLSLCAFAALSMASAQLRATLTQTSPPTQQPVQLRLEVVNTGKTPAQVGRIRGDYVPCPPFKLYNKAGGPPRIERYYSADCDVGETITLPAGERRRFRVQLPWRDLPPGAYTAFLELPLNGKPAAIRADLKVTR